MAGGVAVGEVAGAALSGLLAPGVTAALLLPSILGVAGALGGL